jgi:hypothetical protein
MTTVRIEPADEADGGGFEKEARGAAMNRQGLPVRKARR